MEYSEVLLQNLFDETEATHTEAQKSLIYVCDSNRRNYNAKNYTAVLGMVSFRTPHQLQMSQSCGHEH